MDYKVEIYDSEIEVINRIATLRSEGTTGEDLYVMAREEDMIQRLSHMRSIHTHTQEDDNFWRRIKGFFRGEETVSDMWNRLGVTEQVSDAYEDAVNFGKILLVLESPNPVIGEQWREYLVPEGEYVFDSVKEEEPATTEPQEAYPFEEAAPIDPAAPPNLSSRTDIPPELLSDVLPTDLNAQYNEELRDVPGDPKEDIELDPRRHIF